MAQGSLTVISGFSGSGKGTIIKRLLAARPEQYWFSVSVTTRGPRPGETDGVDYHFIDQSEYDRMVTAGELLEYAGYVGHNYGTPRIPIENHMENGVDVLLDIEIQGAMNVRKSHPETSLLWVMPPTAETLARRLIGRGTEDIPDIIGRLTRAIEEAGTIEQYDAIIINDDLDQAVQDVDETIQECKQVPDHKRGLDMGFVDQFCKELEQLMSDPAVLQRMLEEARKEAQAS